MISIFLTYLDVHELTPVEHSDVDHVTLVCSELRLINPASYIVLRDG